MATVATIIDQILGLAAGYMWGGATSDELLQVQALVDSIVECGCRLNLSAFAQKLQLGDLRDDFLKRVIGHKLFLSDPACAAEDEMKRDPAGGQGAVGLVRGPLCGVFADWEDYAVSVMMCTHVDHRCIVASYLLASVIRNIITNGGHPIEEVIGGTLHHVIATQKMTDPSLIRETIAATAIPLILAAEPPPRGGDGVLGELSRALWCFAACRAGRPLDEIRPHAGGVAGALIGCQMGYAALGGGEGPLIESVKKFMAAMQLSGNAEGAVEVFDDAKSVGGETPSLGGEGLPESDAPDHYVSC
jgi:hypothetical protein